MDMSALKRAIQMNIYNDKEDDQPAVGLHTFADLVEIQVRGAVNRAEDALVRPTYKLPLLEILALLVAHSKYTAPKIIKTIRDAVKLQQNDKKGRAVADFIEVTKASMRKVEDELIDQMPMVPRRGSLTGRVEVSVLSVSPLDRAMLELAEERQAG